MRTQAFVKVGDNGETTFVGERADATRFEDVIEATRFAGKLVEKLLKTA